MSTIATKDGVQIDYDDWARASPSHCKTHTLSALIVAAAVAVSVITHSVFAADAGVRGVRNVVLVHGAWADGSSWSKVIPLLEEAGLNAVAVQNPLTSLEDDLAATKRAIALQDGPVILFGHSWGGVVITDAGAEAFGASLAVNASCRA